MSPAIARVLRISGGVLVLLGGSVHLQQWWTVYRDQDFGPILVANVVASLVIGVALFAYDHPLPAVAGLGLSLASLAALLASRTVGLPWIEASGYETPEIEAAVVEALASVVLAAYLVVWWRTRSTTPSTSTRSTPSSSTPTPTPASTPASTPTPTPTPNLSSDRASSGTRR